MSALLCLPYLLVVGSFFSTDDWVHLQYNGMIPPWQVWRYFSPRVIWFYRPLQALQFGWLYHSAGLRPMAYNLCLLLMHLSVCVLVYLLATRLATPRMALLTTGLFAMHWRGSDMMLWRSNFSTLHWALMTLGLCLLFLHYLENRRLAWLLAAHALFLLDLLAKETAVTSPLLLAALWCWQGSGSDGSLPLRRRLSEGVRIIGPFVLIAGAYAGFHGHVVRDVYMGYIRPHYCYSSFAGAIRQTLCSFNSSLLSFSRDPVLLPQVPLLRSVVQHIVMHGLILPFGIAAIAWRRNDRLLGLGVFWTFATLVPTAWLTVYYMHRFFYLPAIGTSLITARAAQCCWRFTASRTGRWRSLRLAAPVGLAYLAAANLATVTLLCLSSRDDSRLLAAAFQCLQENARLLPQGSLVVLKNAPEPYFGSGLGVAEMVRLGLGDATAQGILEHQPLSGWWLTRMNQYHSIYVLDFARRPFALRSVSQAPRLAHRPSAGEERIAAAAVSTR